MKFNKDDFYQFFFLLVVLVSIFYVKDIYYFKGRFDMCEEKNGIYLNNESCIDTKMYNLLHNQTQPKSTFNSNITVNI